MKMNIKVPTIIPLLFCFSLLSCSSHSVLHNEQQQGNDDFDVEKEEKFPDQIVTLNKPFTIETNNTFRNITQANGFRMRHVDSKEALLETFYQDFGSATTQYEDFVHEKFGVDVSLEHFFKENWFIITVVDHNITEGIKPMIFDSVSYNLTQKTFSVKIFTIVPPYMDFAMAATPHCSIIPKSLTKNVELGTFEGTMEIGRIVVDASEFLEDHGEN